MDLFKRKSGEALSVRVSPYQLSPEGSLQDVLSGNRFLEILPLLQWLREICGHAFSVNPSPPKACFIFDDPNLHWPRYGYVDYRQLAEQAQIENYHVAFATIPLDTWFTHRRDRRHFSTTSATPILIGPWEQPR